MRNKKKQAKEKNKVLMKEEVLGALEVGLVVVEVQMSF